jgi:PAS domain S-box-containing protein
MDNLNFIPVDREIKLDPDKSLIYKITPDGIIDYVNDYFSEITGYEVHEVVGNNYKQYLHKEIPQTIINLAFDKMKKGENFHFVFKDQAKDGRHYWFVTDFEFKYDKDKNIQSITSIRKAAPRVVIPKIEKLYKKMVKMEQHASMEIAQKFFNGFLEEKGMSFGEYTKSIIDSYEIPQTSIQPQQQFQLPQQQPTVIKKKPKKKKSLIDKLFKK